MKRVVLDTDVVTAALRSPGGASAEIVRLVKLGQLRWLVSVPLMLEYEAVTLRAEQLEAMRQTPAGMQGVLDDIAALAEEVHPHYLWRPQTRDAADEMVLETAVNGRAHAIITFNLRDFGQAPARFGVALCTPSQFLRSFVP